MAQHEVPAHIAQEYCRTDLALTKKRSFTELEFPRTLKFDIWKNDKTESWFPLNLDNKLGRDIAVGSFQLIVGAVGRWGHVVRCHWRRSKIRQAC
ncbi:TPA: hypothetical protein OO122_002680 [Legionella pneumophila]|nr:hypothetical protein [Legionella pneumophila]HAT2067512.1 hypothetical protein [Legionella pneumophila]HAT8593611.1 hypothetical protein [Legionella pneumophila]HAU1577682.1 hypothetical protein [Legionella pneumophila]HAU1681471.1 hypothetical protein [Legionella pneumophila]HAU3701381.1 hypothetical protein [Legionella pneumophila]